MSNLMERKMEPCTVCGTPTVDQWGGYCHDCDSYFEAVAHDLNTDVQAELYSRDQVNEID